MVKLLAKERYGFDDTWSVSVNMVVVETNYKRSCDVFKVDDELLALGKEEFEYLMGLVYKNRKSINCLQSVLNVDQYADLFGNS